MRHATRAWLLRCHVHGRSLMMAAGVVGYALTACSYDDSDWELDQGSGATSARGGTKNQSGAPSKAGMNASGGEAGADSVDPNVYVEPKIDSLSPESGAYGTTVTIKGEGLLNPALSGYKLKLGDEGEVEISPDSDGMVVSWTDTEISFRYPFPAEGAVTLETPRDAVVAGEFQPTWHIGQEIEQAPAATLLASISPEPGRVELLFDTMPMTLLEVGPDGVVNHTVTADDVVPWSVRLFLSAGGKVEGVGVSDAAEPAILHLQNQNGDLVAKGTTIKLAATEFSVAGGSEGAAVWMRRSGGWYRARPSGTSFAQDKGPIADADPDAPDRASGATSDGSLFVAWSVDTGNFLDDMEAPYMAKLAPTATKFAAETAAGGSVDDYVSSLTLTSHGDGLVVRVCGSDVDPFGLSGTDRYCYDSLHAPSGAHLFHVPVNAKPARTPSRTNERSPPTAPATTPG